MVTIPQASVMLVVALLGAGAKAVGDIAFSCLVSE
jgi:hypothetical protein